MPGRNRNPYSKEEKKAIGDRIRKARLGRDGMTQRQLGKKIGVTERTIQSYEQGEVVPHRFGGKLEEVLGEPSSWFWTGERPQDGSEQYAEILKELHSLRREVTKMAKALESMGVSQSPKAA